MKPCRILFLVLVLVFLPSVQSSLPSPLSEARHFLRTHVGSAPKAEELERLQHESPAAYELVKALLDKKSFGLAGVATSFAQESMAPAAGFESSVKQPRERVV
mmetsp:Transcript_68002/g.107854  ORF Transcript_68002/g.107854 Transcript_68002/m.107854 type:complete len:103 (+) Transcript_68002:112-420(+)